MTKHTILFLAANPLGTSRLALDEESRAIQEELERSARRDSFELVTRWAVRPLDLLRALRKLKPIVVHFSGRGGSSASDDHQCGLYFQGADKRPQLVSTAALKETFGAAGLSVRLIVLSACYSEAQAEALLAHVPCVVGMRGSVTGDVARSFAIGFYGGLGEAESVAAAYRQGRAAISLEGMVDSETPQLKVRTGVDTSFFLLADEGEPGSAMVGSAPAPISTNVSSTEVKPLHTLSEAAVTGQTASVDPQTRRSRPTRGWARRVKQRYLMISFVSLLFLICVSIGYLLVEHSSPGGSTVFQRSGNNGVNVNGSGVDVHVSNGSVDK